MEDNGNVVEMSLPGSVFTSSAIINSLPQVPVPLTSSAGAPGAGSGNYQLTVSLPTVPVASMQNQTQQIQVSERGGSQYHAAITTMFPGPRDSVQSGLFTTTASAPGSGLLFTNGE